MHWVLNQLEGRGGLAVPQVPSGRPEKEKREGEGGKECKRIRRLSRGIPFFAPGGV